jgi:hypothetical protein
MKYYVVTTQDNMEQECGEPMFRPRGVFTSLAKAEEVASSFFRGPHVDEWRVNGAHKAAKNRTAKAIDEMADVAEQATEMRAQGASLGMIAKALNEDGGVTRQGGSWSATQVKRVLDRANGKVSCRRRQHQTTVG